MASRGPHLLRLVKQDLLNPALGSDRCDLLKFHKMM